MTAEQVRFFDTFGYLVVPGAVAAELDWIIEQFEATFTDLGIEHDGSSRSIVVPFLDQRLGSLLEHPVIDGILSELLGPDYNYVGSDGNRYTGDTGWHSDGFHTVGRYLKVAFYLDPVRATSGALRVIPGTHRSKDDPKREATWSDQRWGIPHERVPCVSLDSDPGDVVVFNHNLMHASFGGSRARRMFTINCCTRAQDQEQIDDLESYIAAHSTMWLERVHSRSMRDCSPPERLVHLEQVMEHDGHLAALSARARADMAESTAHGWETTL